MHTYTPIMFWFNLQNYCYPDLQTSEGVHGEGNLLSSLRLVCGEWKASNPFVSTISGTRGCPICQRADIHIPNE